MHSSELTNGEADFFADPSTLALTASDPSIGTDHDVPATGLLDNKRYFFKADDSLLSYQE